LDARSISVGRSAATLAGFYCTDEEKWRPFLSKHSRNRATPAAALATKAAEDRRTAVFRSGGALVDIADRDALYQAMEGR
jgi:hypothetical protein